MTRSVRRLLTAALTIGFIALVSYLAVPIRAPGPPIYNVKISAEGEPASPPRLVSDLTGWGEKPDGTFDFTVGQMTPDAENPRLFSIDLRLPAQARIEYLIAYGPGDYRLDPRNPVRATGASGERSEIRAAFYRRIFEMLPEDIAPQGRTTEEVISSAKLGGTRRVIVYESPGVTEQSANPLIVFHDGQLMLDQGKVPIVIDYLVGSGAMRPVVAVFVEPASRAEDYRRGAPMQEFAARELIDWINSRYGVTRLASERAIIGVSAGGRAALETAERFPNVFGRCGLLIPALDDADIALASNQISAHAPKVILAAMYDALYLPGARRLYSALLARRDHPVFIEVPEGHNTTTWKNHLHEVLAELFPAR